MATQTKWQFGTSFIHTHSNINMDLQLCNHTSILHEFFWTKKRCALSSQPLEQQKKHPTDLHQFKVNHIRRQCPRRMATSPLQCTWSKVRLVPMHTWASGRRSILMPAPGRGVSPLVPGQDLGSRPKSLHHHIHCRGQRLSLTCQRPCPPTHLLRLAHLARNQC